MCTALQLKSREKQERCLHSCGSRESQGIAVTLATLRSCIATVSSEDYAKTLSSKNCDENPISANYHRNLFSEDYGMLF